MSNVAILSSSNKHPESWAHLYPTEVEETLPQPAVEETMAPKLSVREKANFCALAIIYMIYARIGASQPTWKKVTRDKIQQMRTDSRIANKISANCNIESGNINLGFGGVGTLGQIVSIFMRDENVARTVQGIFGQFNSFAQAFLGPVNAKLSINAFKETTLTNQIQASTTNDTTETITQAADRAMESTGRAYDASTRTN